MLWEEKERSRVRAVQMDRVPNSWVRELCRVKKGLDERIAEGILWWFGHVEKDRIAKRVCR